MRAEAGGGLGPLNVHEHGRRMCLNCSLTAARVVAGRVAEATALHRRVDGAQEIAAGAHADREKGQAHTDRAQQAL